MKKELIKYTINNIRKRSLRNSLTILSILIGISAVFILLSFGSGLTKYTNEMFQKMGTDKIILRMKSFLPGSSQETFSEDDYNFIKSKQDIKEIAGIVFSSIEVKKDKKSRPIITYISGAPTGKEHRLIEEVYTLNIVKGRDLKNSDKYNAVLGNNYLYENKVFRKPVKLGDVILIKNIPFKVIGFYSEVGNPQDDKAITIPLDTARELLNKKGYDFIIARVKDSERITEITDKLSESLRKHKKLKKGSEDFFIQTFEQVMETYGSVITILNSLLVLIAGVSILVASTNIINSLYTSVYERTKEVGILKAIGAKNSDIVFIFTLEASIIGFLGGIFGVIFGYIVSKILGEVVKNLGFSMLQPYFSSELIIGSVIFSTLISLISGTFPAKNASKLNPVNSLRYE